jgi:putative FmdB family regulatory protein|tara:strand:- start:298 stop:504 length:207 start_codon:yes stop_codon:yes gene_type:complete
MPIYEYQCTNSECNHKIEYFQKINEDAIEYCPHCNNKSLKKLISASTFVLKGSGWHKSPPQPKESTDK